MIKIERFVFNPFQENTYIVYDETGESLIIDPGCQDQYEEEQLSEYLVANNLKLVGQIYTHCHIDHILGNGHIFEKYGLKPMMHKESLQLFLRSSDQGRMFDVEVGELIEPEVFFSDGDFVSFGNSSLEVLYSPGHVDGHVCFVNHDEKMVIVGDVLFRDSIGRTDLPTGDFHLLASSIRSKLYTLGTDFVVYPGHGPETSIGHEMLNNPFVLP